MEQIKILGKIKSQKVNSLNKNKSEVLLDPMQKIGRASKILNVMPQIETVSRQNARMDNKS